MRPAAAQSNHRVFDRAEQGSRLYEYLDDILDTLAEDIAPTTENLLAYFGPDSNVFKTATALLTEAHRENRRL